MWLVAGFFFRSLALKERYIIPGYRERIYVLSNHAPESEVTLSCDYIHILKQFRVDDGQK